jgi:threonine dehydrogenase-like Zn-dependent dehydrogenase
MPQGKVAVFHKPGIPLEIRVEETPPPLPHEILARVLLAGVCGTDVHRLSGHVPVQPHPVCFGHETVGQIVSLGSDITVDSMGSPIKVGDNLYWNPSTPCGDCDACKRGNQMLCQDLNWPSPAGSPNAAGFREFATLNRKNITVKIPEGTCLESVITFGCAMPTALRGFSKMKGLGPESRVVIQGSGPVGLASTLLANLAGAKTIIAIGDPDSRLEITRKLGATETLSVSSMTPAERKERILELTDGKGAEFVIEAAGFPSAFPEGFGLLGMNGQFLIMGLYSGKAGAVIDPVRINNLNLSIVGSLGIREEDYARTVQIATEHGERLKFAHIITHRFPLEKLEEAIGVAARGESIKTVIVPRNYSAYFLEFCSLNSVQISKESGFSWEGTRTGVCGSTAQTIST